jgi:hypothetical protein
MYNIHHTASTPGAADAFRPPSRRRGPRALRRRRARLTRAEAVEPVEGGRLVALGERRAVDDRLDEVLR